MTINQSDVAYIANLARLDLNEKQKQDMETNLSKILDYIDQLNEVDTANITPTAHVLDLTNILREDLKKTSLPLNEALANAPEATEDGFFKVPQIIE